MFIPIGDEPNPSEHLPAATIAIIAINVAVYLFITLPFSMRPPDPGDPALAEYLRVILPLLPSGTPVEAVLQQVSAYDLVLFRWGFRASNPSFVTLVTGMFLHAGFMHLAGNMLYLWVYGNNVEHRLGALPYVFWYLVTGAAATLFQTLFNLGSPIPLVGASGAISGVLGFYLVWFPHNTVRLFVFLFPFYIGTVHLSATLVLALFLILDNLLPFVIAPTASGVAHGAHIGGFVAGMAVAWLMREVRTGDL
jgi:membrane associated rhomboid family serine protease